jgi:hypothetical protein
MPQTLAVVGHLVYHSGDVRDLGVVSVKTLVQGRQSEQIRRCFQRGSGAFAAPKHDRSVVTKGGGGGFPNVEVLGEDVLVGDITSKFQVGVRDSPRRVRAAWEAVSEED